ncbi:MAG: serine/threonine-protein kinase [Kofleriaceae bacterium]
MSEDPHATLLGAGPEASTQKYLERGTTVGRYVVLDRLGEGGMGIVYRAFDPELARMVALKLLHTRSQTGTTIGDATWLLREAQALAKLSHPNVVIVHDVGVIRDDQVFIAMELVDGSTLRSWLSAQKRTWREVRDVMLAAGAGLAAAHAAKLVHRDFKPENVIVGKDGRVRVMDFGLARHRQGDTIPPPGDLDPLPGDNAVTVAEGVMGTPAYMAPELFDGDIADARSDQYSFGVVLFEALSGARPYAKDLVPPRTAPAPVMPAKARVPARVADAAVRAVSADRAKRFPSLDALLGVLAFDPAAGRRRIWAGLGAIVAVSASVVATRIVSSPTPCQGIEHRLAGIWDPPTRAKIEAAYRATKLPYADKAYIALAPALDRYTSAWVEMATDSCQATRVRGDQTEDVLSLRQACLDQELAELGALTKVLVEPNPLVIAKAAGVAEELDKVTRCANIRALRAPLTPSAAVAAQLPPIHAQLATAKAATITQRLVEAGAAASKATELAKLTGFQPIIAETMAVEGAIQKANALDAQAEQTLTEVVWAAEVGQVDELVAEAAIALANSAIYAQPARVAEAKIWLGFAIAAARRVGLDHVLESDFKLIEAVLDIQEGNVTAAVAAGEASFAASEREYGKDSAVLFGHEILYAGTLARALEYAKAAPHYEHALAVRAQLVGEAYPEVALTLSNLAVCYHFMGELAKARATFVKALALRERLFGPRSPLLVSTLDNYGVFLTQTDDPARARAMLERALVLAELIPGKDSPDYQVVATDRADAVVAQGKLGEAHALFDQLLAQETATHSTTLPVTQTSRAQLALAEKAYPDAERFALQAIAGFQAAGGAENPEQWRALAALGRAQGALGKPAEARTALEHAIAIGTRVQLAADQLAPAREALASLR